MTFDGETRDITQFHYVDWPDYSIPAAMQLLLNMIEQMREVQPEFEPPIVVNCRYVAY